MTDLFGCAKFDCHGSFERYTLTVLPFKAGVVAAIRYYDPADHPGQRRRPPCAAVGEIDRALGRQPTPFVDIAIIRKKQRHRKLGPVVAHGLFRRRAHS